MKKTAVAVLCSLVLGVTASSGIAGASKPLPSFSKVKQAVQSTGVTLCDLTEPGNLSERIFGQSTSGDCPAEAGGGLVHIYTEATNSAATSDVRLFKGDGDSVWIDQTIVVASEDPAPGTNTALTRIGFKRG